MVYFLSMIKTQEERDCDGYNYEYKQKVDYVAEKIDDWHSQLTLQKQGSFHYDNDFIEIGNSPSKFEIEHHQL